MNTPPQSLLTDWLELMDPEIVNADLELQEQLVFGTTSVTMAAKDGRERKRRGNPYLLALLTHQSQWGTIRRCLDRILTHNKISRCVSYTFRLL
jgi:integrator complex subunit 1